MTATRVPLKENREGERRYTESSGEINNGLMGRKCAEFRHRPNN